MYLPALKKLFLQLIAGDYGLTKTYWLFGMGGTFIITEVIAPILDAALSHYSAYAIIPLLAIHQCCAAIGIFKAADKFQGNPAWPFIAKVSAGLSMLMLLLSLMELATAQL